MNGNEPIECTVSSILGLRILYHLYMARIKNLEFSQVPVRHSGCVKEALGVKYVSMVCRCWEGGDCVRRWMTPVISLSEEY